MNTVIQKPLKDTNHNIFESGRYYSFGVDGRRWTFVCGRGLIGVASKSKGHAKSSAVETGKTTHSIAEKSIENRRVGRQGKCSRGRDDVLVSRDEDPIGFDVQTSYCQGNSIFYSVIQTLNRIYVTQ